MTELSDDTHRLLERARGASALSPERRTQLKARLMVQIAAGSALAAATTVTASSKIAWLYGPIAKGLLLFTVASVGAGVYFARQAPEGAPRGVTRELAAARATSPTDVVTPVTEDEADEPSANTPNPGLGSRPRHVAKSSTGIATPASPKKVPTATPIESSNRSPTASVAIDSLAEETRLIREADRALRSGSASRALRLLDEHATRFPRGVLSGERNAERIIAQCKQGQVDESALKAYLSSHPTSALSARIREACTPH